MQPHQGAGASAQLQLHLQQMQAQALRQQQNSSQQQQQLMASNGGFGNMSPNVQGAGHFVNQQVEQSHQQGDSGMGSHRGSFSMGPSGGMPNNSGMCMLPNQMGNHQQMVQGQSNQGNASGQNNGPHAALLWSAVQASGKQGGNMGGSNSGGMAMGGSNSNLKLGMMGNSQMQGMGQHSKQGGSQGFNNSQLHQQANFSASGSSDSSSSMSSGNINKDLAMLQQIQAQHNEILKNNPATNSNNALLLQQQNLIQQLMRQVQQQQQQSQANSNSAQSNSQQQQQGMQFSQMPQRPGSAMGPNSQSHSMLHSSASSDMLQQSMSSILRGRENACSSSSNMPNSNGQTQQQQQKSGDQLNFPGLFHGNQQQQGMANSNQINSGGSSSDALSFNNSSANNSNNINANGVMNMPFQNKLSQGHNVGFGEHVNQGFGMNPMVELTPQQKQLLLMQQQNRPSSGQGSQQAMFQQEQYRKLLQIQKLNSDKSKRLSSSGTDNTDEASISSKQDEDSGGKSPKGKTAPKRGRRSSKTQDKNEADSHSGSESGKNEKANKDAADKKESANDSIAECQDVRGQRPFLDGNFAGGWQSNADLPDRKRIIISIVKLVERMRPDASKMSQKLPLMAKRLEEYLYRSASTKEEYMDSSTLKKRLQKIAHGLGNFKPYQQAEQERPSSNSSNASNNGTSKDISNDLNWFPDMLPANAQDKSMDVQGKGKDAFIREVMKNKKLKNGKLSTPDDSDPEEVAKAQKKVIKQQQQRLLLLRHASKCKEGPNCKTRFCDQMVALWKHMKNCRDKNCKTPHCLSSRCVLNHYRICKSRGRTATCEVCGPVIKDIGENKKMSGDQSGFSPDCFPVSFDASGSSSSIIDDVSSGTSPPETGNSTASLNPKQCAKLLEEIKAAQNKIRQQQILLQQLQNQQLQLLEQQKNSSQPQRAQQLKQQQIILQMQESFQPQQQFCQRELERQTVILQRKQQMLQHQIGSFKNQTEPTKDKVKDEPTQTPDSLMSSASTLENKDAPKPRATRGKGKAAGNDQPARRRNSKTPGKKLIRPKEPASKASDKTSKDATSDAKAKADSVESSKANTTSNKDGASGSTKGKAASASKAVKRPSEAISKDSSGVNPNEEPSSKQIKLEDVDSSSKKATSKEKQKMKEESKDSSRGAKNVKKEDQEEKVLQQGESETNTSLVPSMSVNAIEGHIDSLQEESSTNQSPRRITQKCLPLVKKLIDDKFGWVFRDPVDPEELGLPDYFNVIKNPMDLGKIVTQLENNEYKKFESFEKDVRLVFENAILYNGDNSDVGDMAKSLLNVFETDYKTLMKGMKTDQPVTKRRADACTLCGLHRLLFEPNVIYCNGTCGMQRIRRNASYYSDISKQNNWCTSCYTSLKDDEKVILDDGKEISKNDLQELKNDALAEEAWVQCDDCHNWVHQICALFNGRQNKTAASYTCPKCHLKKLKSQTDAKKGKVPLKNARDLPHCSMSRFIESGVSKALESEYSRRAKSRACSVEEIEKVDTLSIRVVSNMEKKHVVRELMYERYANKGYPSEFPVRIKCILLFQTIHGVDTILYGIYVYEYGKECPLPNRRRVYISYLDSVHYLRPRSYRTFIYQTILIEYLKFVKMRGFHTAHIWSCPPAKGDDYIFYHHPSAQVTPSDSMLCAWYEKMLDQAKNDGVVSEVRTLFDEYFKNNNSGRSDHAVTPCCLPYFEGDYLTGEIENILKNLNTEEKNKKDREKLISTPRDSLNKQQKKKAGKKLGTRSNPGELVNQERDKVMLRLSQILSTMKRNFIIVKLQPDNVVDAMERSDNFEDSSESESIDRTQLSFGDTSDEDPPQESEFFDSRQQFLNFCQTNHFQFDQLRRAKHSTMMVLFHLHNPSAPKFLQQCGSCYREITHGTRYRCNDCSNFDLCQDCYKPVVSGLWAKRDARFAHDKSHTFNPIDMEAKLDNQRTREERAQMIRSHLELVSHTASCRDSDCDKHNCSRMKKLFHHVQTCSTSYKNGCKICARLLSLLSIHSRQCTQRGKCPVPFCDQIRKMNRRVRQQQQLMDDRRRNAQNELHKERS